MIISYSIPNFCWKIPKILVGLRLEMLPVTSSFYGKVLFIGNMLNVSLSIKFKDSTSLD